MITGINAGYEESSQSFGGEQRASNTSLPYAFIAEHRSPSQRDHSLETISPVEIPQNPDDGIPTDRGHNTFDTLRPRLKRRFYFMIKLSIMASFAATQIFAISVATGYLDPTFAALYFVIYLVLPYLYGTFLPEIKELFEEEKTRRSLGNG